MKKTIFFIKAWLLVGILDIAAAMLSFYISTGKSPLIVLKFIASAVTGPSAYADGTTSILLGLALHFSVAFLFTLFFFLVYKPLHLFQFNTLLTGVLYGIFIWVVMNQLILPMTSVKQQPFKWLEAVKAIIILITMIGLPLSLMLKKRYRS